MTVLAQVPFFPGNLLLYYVSLLPQPAATITTIAAGVVFGMWLAYLGRRESLVATVASTSVTLRIRGKARIFDHDQIHTALQENTHLVLLSPNATELAREESDLSRRALARAFRSHGYTWLDADPYAERFRRWVEDEPELSSSANAVLKARAIALHHNMREHAEELRAEIAKLGIVVRHDPDLQQYWRLGEPPPV